MSTYNRRSRKSKNARRKAKKPRPRTRPPGPSRSQRRAGKKFAKLPHVQARIASRKKRS